MIPYIVTIFAVAGLFVNPWKPWLSFYIWTGSNSFWALMSHHNGDYSQMMMFAIFAVASGIQFWRSA